jgi:predicted aminopeptidase
LSQGEGEEGGIFRARTLLLLALAPLLSGCYLLQAARGQLDITVKREPIEEVIADPQTPAATQARLKMISEARTFASKELGLPDNDSYRSYVALKRDYVVWNVFATPPFSVDPINWCFPIAGCVVYRGYFNEEAAQKYARRTRLNGNDAVVGGVAAYSTLGHFKDPVLSTMLRWSDAQIAATLFHELAHQVVYVQDESDFNEAFATVVEETGAERWLQQRNESPALAAWRLARQRSGEFTALLLATRERLRILYRLRLAPMELNHRKHQEFGRLKYEYWQLKASWDGYGGYDNWFNRTLSNADLISAATYQSCVPGLEKLLRESGSDLPRFYEAVKALDEEGRRRVCGKEDPSLQLSPTRGERAADESPLP